MLRAVLRLSAETAETVDGYATHLEGRLDAIARVAGGGRHLRRGQPAHADLRRADDPSDPRGRAGDAGRPDPAPQAEGRAADGPGGPRTLQQRGRARRLRPLAGRGRRHLVGRGRREGCAR
ncbi:hypothetical protein ACU4GR_14765 [Methylobacterium oryzae CBMB20]